MPDQPRRVPTRAERIQAARADGRHLTAETAHQALDDMHYVRTDWVPAADLEQARRDLGTAHTDNAFLRRKIAGLAAELERVTAERDHARTGWQKTADALAKAHTGWGNALQQAYAASAPGSPARAQESEPDRDLAYWQRINPVRDLIAPAIRDHLRAAWPELTTDPVHLDQVAQVAALAAADALDTNRRRERAAQVPAVALLLGGDR